MILLTCTQMDDFRGMFMIGTVCILFVLYLLRMHMLIFVSC